MSEAGIETLDREDALERLALAEACEPEFWGPNLVAAMDRLEPERERLDETLRWAIDQRDAEVALRLGAALWRFWQMRGQMSKGLDWLEQALALETSAPMQVRARALEAAGNLARSLGRYERATILYAGSLQSRLKLGDKRGIALALTNLGVVAQLGGRSEAGVAHHDASFELFRELGDPAGVALSLVTLGTMAQLQGRTAAARSLYEESLSLFRAVSDTRGIAASLNNLANTLTETGELATAREHYREALGHFRDLGDKSEEAACLKNLALVEVNSGALVEARDLCQQSLELFDALADGRGVAACLDVLARLASARGEQELAAEVVGAAQALRDTLQEATVQIDVERPDTAVASIREALGGEVFQTCFEQGRIIPLAEVIEKALGALPKGD